ncbi:uroporphyrinogen-III synthase [Hoeflea sp. YIM 152468]|uniref:uroporphyrinogen-III synthase n=1 Tax=Hoeflea sp. YIM 152468 TaxID=3031759 RepID=UPI0023DB3066|nr:uroporphyrinogen-III synthase [Hoeflea sp. YIM 152468]MDF1608222.1 uroporphyrinogen-III synthase [Hoeflea sp. YIM 152468]
MTRPEPGGQRTAERLARSGYDPVRMPLFAMRLTATPDDLPPVGSIGGLIATSGRAFAMFKSAQELPPELRKTPVHAVGPATAQAAREAGFMMVHEGGGSARALAHALIHRSQSAGAGSGVADTAGTATAMVYLAGVPRRPVIEAALASARRSFSVLECYQMNEISYSTDILVSDFLSPAPGAILFYSANAARRFRAICEAEDLQKRLLSTRFVCLSAAISAELPDDWQGRASVSDSPNEGSLLACLAALR